MKKRIAVMDFGTSKITVLVGSRGLNNTVAVDGISVCDYDGFAEGEWIAPEKLSAAVTRAIDGAKSSAQSDIEKLYIGVPGDFLRCYVNDASIALGKKRRVLDSDVEMLQDQAQDIESDTFELVNQAPVYYSLDATKLIDPVGLVATRLSGRISFMYMDKLFKNAVDSAVGYAGIVDTEYVAVPFAETQYLFDDYRRDAGTLLVDVGALETTLSYGRGDGICYCTSFAWGGDYITLLLRNGLDAFKDMSDELAFKLADKLKRQVNLGLDAQYIIPDDEPGFMQTEYVVDNGGEPLAFRVTDVNAIVEQAIGCFVQLLEQSIKQSNEIPNTVPLSITGGGLNIRGAVEQLKLRIDRNIETVVSKQPTWDNPQYSAALALADTVLSADLPQSGIFGKIKGFFTKRK